MGVVSDIYICVYNHVHSVEKVVIVITASIYYWEWSNCCRIGDVTLTFWRSSSGARVHGSGIRKLESQTTRATVLVKPLLFGVTGRLYVFYSVPTRTNSIPSRRFLRLWDGSADKFQTGNVPVLTGICNIR